MAMMGRKEEWKERRKDIHDKFVLWKGKLKIGIKERKEEDVCVYICVYISIYMCIYVYICVYIYIYILIP